MEKFLKVFNTWKAVIIAISIIIGILFSTKIWLANWIGFNSKLEQQNSELITDIKNKEIPDLLEAINKIQNNELRHLDLYEDYMQQKTDLMFDLSLGDISKENIQKKRIELEVWYRQEKDKLNKE
jgi:hypothetical protein